MINSQPHRLAIEQQGSLPPQQLRSKAALQYLAAKPAPSSSGSIQPQPAENIINTQRTRRSTARKLTPSTASSLSASTPSFQQHPTSNSPRAVPQQQLPQQYYGSALAVHSIPAFTAPNIQLPNCFTQYPSVATQLSSKPPPSTRLSI